MCARARAGVYGLIVCGLISLRYFPNVFKERCPKMSPNKISTLPNRGTTQIVLSAWDAMLWTYREQAVLAANQVRMADGDVRGSGLALDRIGESGIAVSATINGQLAAHEDAYAIDAFVRAYLHDDGVVRGRDSNYVVITRATARGQAIRPVRVDLPRPEMVVAKNDKGAPIKLYDHNRNLIGFKQEWRDGLTPEMWQAAQDAQAAFHRLFLSLLDAMCGKRFGSRMVSERGLTGYEESLTTPPTMTHVCPAG